MLCIKNKVSENCLYLCGSNKPSLHSSQTTGSYLFRYDLENNLYPKHIGEINFSKILEELEGKI